MFEKLRSAGFVHVTGLPCINWGRGIPCRGAPIFSQPENWGKWNVNGQIFTIVDMYGHVWLGPCQREVGGDLQGFLVSICPYGNGSDLAFFIKELPHSHQLLQRSADSWWSEGDRFPPDPVKAEMLASQDPRCW